MDLIFCIIIMFFLNLIYGKKVDKKDQKPSPEIEWEDMSTELDTICFDGVTAAQMRENAIKSKSYLTAHKNLGVR